MQYSADFLLANQLFDARKLFLSAPKLTVLKLLPNLSLLTGETAAPSDTKDYLRVPTSTANPAQNTAKSTPIYPKHQPSVPQKYRQKSLNPGPKLPPQYRPYRAN